MESRLLLVAFVLSSLSLLPACQQKRPVVLDPPLDMVDLAAGLPKPSNAYMLLTDDGSVGRFATSLAIARLAVAEDGPDYCLRLADVPASEQARWTTTFSAMYPVKDIVFLSPRNARTAGTDFNGLCAAADTLGARLLLLYVPNHHELRAAQVLGVIFDVVQRKPLATLQVERSVPTESEAAEEDDDDLDPRTVDAPYQAGAAFHTLAFDCIREMVRLDQPQATPEPHDWATPYVERWWVPVR